MRPFAHSRQRSFSIRVTERCNDPNPPPFSCSTCQKAVKCHHSCVCVRARLHVRGQAYAGWIEAERLVIVALLRCRLQRSRPSAYSVLALNYKWPCDVLPLTDQSGWRLLPLSKHGRCAGWRRLCVRNFIVSISGRKTRSVSKRWRSRFKDWCWFLFYFFKIQMSQWELIGQYNHS